MNLPQKKKFLERLQTFLDREIIESTQPVDDYHNWQWSMLKKAAELLWLDPDDYWTLDKYDIIDKYFTI